MNYGFHLAAAGALTSLYRQDLLANNLANMKTIGFKADVVDTRQRLPERLERPGAFVDPQLMLEQLGGGQFLMPTRVAFAQGDLVSTGSPLDVAIQGDGFFSIEVGTQRGPEHLRLTRDGRFTLNADGELVTASDGRRVLGENGGAIRLDPTQRVTIGADGALIQNGAVAARLQIVGVEDARSLRKAGGGLLRLIEGARPDRSRPSGRVLQGHTESAAVDPIITLNNMMNAAKAAQGNLTMLQYHDNVLGQAFNTFGRVA